MWNGYWKNWITTSSFNRIVSGTKMCIVFRSPSSSNSSNNHHHHFGQLYRALGHSTARFGGNGGWWCPEKNRWLFNRPHRCVTLRDWQLKSHQKSLKWHHWQSGGKRRFAMAKNGLFNRWCCCCCFYYLVDVLLNLCPLKCSCSFGGPLF